MTNLTLWGIGTPRTMRAHWMLMEFGVGYDYRPITSRSGETLTPEYLAINPKHKIPALQHGELTITESFAIVSYIADAFDPPDGFFVPQDPARRAALNEWCSFILMELDALSTYVIRKHADLSDIYGDAPAAVESAKDYYSELSGAVFDRLDPNQEFLMEEGMSVADILMTTCLVSAIRRGIAVPDYLLAYRDRMTERPAWKAAWPRNHPET
jgi:glutathione S-transferase